MLTIPFFTKPDQTNWEKYAFMTLGRQKLCKLCKLCKFQLSFSKLSTFRFSIFSRNFGVFFRFLKKFHSKSFGNNNFRLCNHARLLLYWPRWCGKEATPTNLPDSPSVAPLRLETRNRGENPQILARETGATPKRSDGRRVGTHPVASDQIRREPQAAETS